MTIGEKASEYAEKCFPSDDINNSGKHDVAFHSYIAGANWMLDKTINWMHDKGFFDTVEYTINIEKFIRAMEE